MALSMYTYIHTKRHNIHILYLYTSDITKSMLLYLLKSAMCNILKLLDSSNIEVKLVLSTVCKGFMSNSNHPMEVKERTAAKKSRQNDNKLFPHWEIKL